MDNQTRIVGVGAGALFVIVALVHQMMPPTVANILLVILGVVALWGFWPLIRRGWENKWMWPQYLMAISAFGFLIGFVAFLPLNGKAPPTTEKGGDKAVELSLLVDCVPSSMPNQSPIDGSIRVIEFKQEGTITKIYSTDYRFQPNQPIDWTKLTTPFPPLTQAISCNITAIGNIPIFDVSIPFDAEFRKPLPYKEGDTTKVGDQVFARTGFQPLISGPIVETLAANISIRRLDVIPPSVIFIVNKTKNFMTVKFPDAAQRGIDKEQSIVIKKSVAFDQGTGPSLFD